MDPSSQPPPSLLPPKERLESLNAIANIQLGTTQYSFKIWCHTADKLDRQGEAFFARKDVDNSYVSFMKFCNVALEVLPKLPEFKELKKRNDVTLLRVRKRALEVLVKLEGLQKIILGESTTLWPDDGSTAENISPFRTQSYYPVTDDSQPLPPNLPPQPQPYSQPYAQPYAQPQAAHPSPEYPAMPQPDLSWTPPPSFPTQPSPPPASSSASASVPSRPTSQYPGQPAPGGPPPPYSEPTAANPPANRQTSTLSKSFSNAQIIQPKVISTPKPQRENEEDQETETEKETLEKLPVVPGILTTMSEFTEGLINKGKNFFKPKSQQPAQQATAVLQPNVHIRDWEADGDFVVLNKASESEMAFQRAGIQTAAIASTKPIPPPINERPPPPLPPSALAQNSRPAQVDLDPPVSESHQHPESNLLEGEVVGHAVALYDFDPINPGDIALRTNDQCEVLGTVDSDGWISVRVNGQTGFVPADYLSFTSSSS